MTPKTLYQGAEAKIILSGSSVIKDRIPKSYRLPELDEKIRKQRTRSETKLLNKASDIINSPKPLINKSWGVDNSAFNGATRITMPFIDGKKLSEHLDNFPLNKQKQICRQIGESVAKLHDADIIHGDLTTSNMILVEGKNTALQKDYLKVNRLKSKRKIMTKSDLEQHQSVSKANVYFIDFGLGFHSRKLEDKAVDIHLLKQALEAKHFKHWEMLFNEFLKGYKKLKDAEKVLERLKAVEKRGRYKG